MYSLDCCSWAFLRALIAAGVSSLAEAGLVLSSEFARTLHLAPEAAVSLTVAAAAAVAGAAVRASLTTTATGFLKTPVAWSQFRTCTVVGAARAEFDAVCAEAVSARSSELHSVEPGLKKGTSGRMQRAVVEGAISHTGVAEQASII